MQARITKVYKECLRLQVENLITDLEMYAQGDAYALDRAQLGALMLARMMIQYRQERLNDGNEKAA